MDMFFESRGNLTPFSQGFTQLKNPILRNTLARAVNIAQAIKIKHTDIDQLLKELNESLKAGKS